MPSNELVPSLEELVNDAMLPTPIVVRGNLRFGAMSDFDSARTDNFYEGGLSAPSYTRSPEYRGFTVPEVLLSGDHKRIAEWRRAQAERLTRERHAR